MNLKIFIPSADYPCLAQRVGTIRALSGLAPIKLSYLRLRDQKRNSPQYPQVSCQRLSRLCTKLLKTKRKNILKSLLDLSDNQVLKPWIDKLWSRQIWVISALNPGPFMLFQWHGLLTPLSGAENISNIMSYTCAFPAMTTLIAVNQAFWQHGSTWWDNSTPPATVW